MSRLIDLAVRQDDPKTHVDFLREHNVTVFVWPAAWRDTNVANALNWEKVEFGRDTVGVVAWTYLG